MLVIPGLELTFNDDEPLMAAHAVAFGLREFVSVDEAMSTAAQAGAAVVAAHPNADEPALARDPAQDWRSASAESPVTPRSGDASHGASRTTRGSGSSHTG